MTDAAKVERWGHRLSELLDEMRRSEIGEYSPQFRIALETAEFTQLALADAADECEAAHVS